MRLLTPAPPGSASDLILRGIAEVLSSETKQSHFVENRTGANGFIATRGCAGAEPNGLTYCLLSSVNVAFTPAIFKNTPYDSKEDLVPVALLGFFPAGLWVSAKLPVNSIDELFDYAKKNPGKLNFATFGAASSSTVTLNWLKNVRGLEFTSIPYRSALDAFRGVIAGEADVTSFAMGPGVSTGRPDQVKVLAIDSAKRLPAFQHVPTYDEVKIESVMGWFGFFAPKGTSPELADRIHAAITKGLVNDPERRKRILDNAGIVVSEPMGGSRADFVKFVSEQIDLFAKHVRDAKMEKMDWK